MLPNWLYGKSKSKLASILGGGGTPTDYDQVKAQVTQNATEISSVKQALTNNVNQNGCKNLLPYVAKNVASYANITFTPYDNGTVAVSNTQASAISDFYLFSPSNKNTDKLPINLERDADYILSVSRTNKSVRLILNFYDSDGNNISGTQIEAYTSRTFNLSTIDPNEQIASYRAFLRVGNGETPSANTVLYPMIRLATDTDDTYVPYAMTNQELTEKLTANSNLGTAVNLSTYTSYSNLYTAPSDGYVHFLSAASGSAARTIYTYGNNTTAATDPHFTHSTSANNKAFEIFIKKGLKIYVDGLQSGDTISFYPLS